MPKLDTTVALVIDRQVVESECSICHDVIVARGSAGTIEDREAELRDAIARHARERHSLAT